ncbi:hypothetical protein ACHAWC_010281 [Mediolabrus comicus]
MMFDPAVLALATLGLVDSVSFMIVAPSLAFYVEKLGGSQDAYGFILAVYSFASFCGKPILGRWSDAQGFMAPYMVSIAMSTWGGLLYAIAPAFESTQLALVALGRILGGLGRANSALGFAYVARALPASERTSVTAILGGVQMIGMAIAPLFSALLADVNFDLGGLHFDNLNSVGLVLLLINFASQVMIYFLLPELPPNNNSEETIGQVEQKESEWLKMLRFIFRMPHIGIPFLTIFTFNFNWQFIETALAPASADALGWTPVQVSYVLGAMAILVFVGMTSVHKLSQMGVTDYTLLCYGLLANAAGYFLLYITWKRGASIASFVIPVFISAGSFAFLGAPNRSLFSKSVDATPQLAGLEGTMQALLSMASSVGGFTAPSVVAHYCLRTPAEVDVSSDTREFTGVALLSPALGFIIFVANKLVGEPEEVKIEATIDSDEEICQEDGEHQDTIDETTPLNIDRRRSDGDRPVKSSSSSDKRRQLRRQSLVETSFRGSCNLAPENDLDIFNNN